MEKYFICFVCLLVTLMAQAALPYTCSNRINNFSFQNNQLLLKGGDNTQRFYLFTNTSKQTVWLDIAVHSGTAQAGWGSQIQPGHYSIVAMTQATFTFTCNFLDQNYKLYSLNCQHVLSVCQLETIPLRDGKLFPPGSGWVYENVKQ